MRLQHQRRFRRSLDGGFLWDEVQIRMLERMQWVKQRPVDILVLGDANLRDANSLGQAYPQSSLTVLDWSWSPAPGDSAQAPLETAAGTFKPLAWARNAWLRLLETPARDAHTVALAATGALRIAADVHQMPLHNARFDLLWSNGLLHWSDRWPELLAELHRCAKPQALFSFSLLGVDSFAGLRKLAPDLMAFPDMHDLGDALVRSGWAEPVVDMDRMVLSWRNARDLIADLRALGGHLHPNRAKGLRSRVWLAKLEAALEVLRQADGLYRLEIELIFGHAWRSPDRPKAEAWQPIELRPKSA